MTERSPDDRLEELKDLQAKLNAPAITPGVIQQCLTILVAEAIQSHEKIAGKIKEPKIVDGGIF